MYRPSSTALAAAVGVLSFTACTSDIAIENETIIACESNRECPEGFVCRNSIRRCVEASADSTAPSLSLMSLTPAVARIESEVVVVVSADEPLFAAPSVALDLSPPRIFTVSESDAQTATLTYTIRGDEPEGVINLVGEAIDRAGNASTNVSLGSLRLDFTPPRLVGALEVNPTLVGADDVVTVSFSVDEALAVAPQMRVRWPGDPVAPREGTLIETTGDAAAPSFTFEVTPAPGGEAGVGPADIEVIVTDAVGNTASQTRIAELDTDLVGPGPIPGTGFVRLFPAVENPLRSVTAAGPGTVVQVGLVMDEPLGDSPQLMSFPTGLAFVAVSVSGNTAVFEATVPSDLIPIESAETFEVTAADAFGNEATHAVLNADESPLAMTLDTLSPDAPDPALMVYHRSPWGSIDSGHEAGFWVTAQEGALAAETTVRILDREDVAAAAEVGRGTSDAVGGIERIELPSIDRTRVYVVAVDEAGNQSSTSADAPRATPVENVHWIASLGGKVVGETFANPHRFETMSVALDRLSVADASEFGSQSGVASADDGGAGTTSAGAGSWERFEPVVNELQRTTEQAMDFDGNAGSVLAFGSDGPLVCLLQLDERFVGYSRGGWQNILEADDVAPSRRGGAQMVFDTDRNEMVLFGPNEETWTWDGSEWTQRCLTPSCSMNAPAARQGHTMVFDRNRSVVVLFGGFFGQGVNTEDTNEIWEWDGASWTEACTSVACTSQGPSARRDHAAAFDPIAGQMVVHGGSPGSSETWLWDGIQWQQACTSAPCSDTVPSVGSVAAAWDEARQEMVLFGSDRPPDLCSTAFSLLPQTWTWDGSRWTDRSGGPQPIGRSGTELAYDPLLGAVVLMGGETPFCGMSTGCAETRLSDTWLWDGTGWVEAPPSVAPTASALTAGSWVGGADRGLIALNADGEHYRWLGSFWSEQPGMAPDGRRDMAFATYVATDGDAEALMVGGRISGSGALTAETWRFGDGGWASESPGPSARLDSAMAWSGESVVLYGGGSVDSYTDGFGDTWLWTPSSGWQSVDCGADPCPPGALADHRMAWTGNPGEVLLYGGGVTTSNGTSNAVWRFDGTTWTREPDNGPGSRLSHAMVYDEARDAVLVTGGYRTRFVQLGRLGPADPGLWFWQDGQGWSQAREADPEGDGDPLRWVDGVASYDADLQRSVFFGTQYGSNANFNDGSTWLYNSGATSRPGHRASVAFGSAGGDGDEAISDVVVRWLGEANGDSGGASTPGVRLRVWDQGQWRELAREETAALTWSFTSDGVFNVDPTLLSRLFRGSAQEIVVEVSPQHPNGTLRDYGAITTDYIEVEVRYRL